MVFLFLKNDVSFPFFVSSRENRKSQLFFNQRHDSFLFFGLILGLFKTWITDVQIFVKIFFQSLHCVSVIAEDASRRSQTFARRWSGIHPRKVPCKCMKIIAIVSRISVSFDAIWVIIWGGIGSLWVETPAWHRLIQKHAAHTNRLQLM